MMKKIFFLIALVALLVGMMPTAALAQSAPTVELAELDSLFGPSGYLCYPDVSSGSHVKVPLWPRGLVVASPMSKVEQPYATFTSGQQPKTGVTSDVWLDANLSDTARANCPSMPDDGAGNIRNLAITKAEVQEALGGPDAEFLCFWDRKDGVHVNQATMIDPPVTHIDTSSGVVVRGTTLAVPTEGTAWLQGKLSTAEWSSCPKWGTEPENRLMAPSIGGFDMNAFIQAFVQWFMAGGSYTFPALPVAPTATITPTETLTTTATLTNTDTVTLTVEVSQRSWVRVVADDVVVLEGIREPGFVEQFAATGKMFFRTGNAGGVKLTLNGDVQPSLGESGAIAEWSWTAGTPSVAGQIDAAGLAGSWSCFDDRLNAVLVPVWPDGVAVPDFVDKANTPGADLSAGGLPAAGDRVTLWFVSGLAVDRAECPTP